MNAKPINKLQLDNLFPEFDQLQKIYGDPGLNAIYGAGCTFEPNLMMIFMNPTARNIASNSNWAGLRAPWLGTKNIWNMFHKLDLIEDIQFNHIDRIKSECWTEAFSEKLYRTLSQNNIYITNLAKCTQKDARRLNDGIFKKYLRLLYLEIADINPKKIVTFGVQVSSIVTGKKITMENSGSAVYNLSVSEKCYGVIPVYYPVGQGQMNMQKSIKQISRLLRSN